jgi:predicted lipid-binding transport protein (Tim44 family)
MLEFMTRRPFARFAVGLTALTLIFSSMAVDYAEARRGGSFGSRGTRTYQSAPATNTAPAAAPVQRSMTTPGQAAAPAAGAAAGAAGARASRFGSGLGGTLMRGLLIGGLFGLLMGAGFGGFAGFLGLLVQGLLIALVVMLAIRFFRRRKDAQQPAMAGMNPMRREAETMHGTQPLRGAGGGGAAVGRPGTDAVGVKPADLDVFEQRLVALQAAFSREDHDALDRIATPEVASYLAEEMAQNEARGIRTEASDVTLLQGDVAESWREGNREYATVAMRYGMRETTRDRRTGAIVDGVENRPVESTEIWTFVRERGDSWKLSAIQS